MVVSYTKHHLKERLGRILRRLVDGRKLGIKSLWVCAYKTKLESHEMEEDYSFSRLLSGYDTPNHDLIVSVRVNLAWMDTYLD